MDDPVDDLSDIFHLHHCHLEKSYGMQLKLMGLSTMDGNWSELNSNYQRRFDLKNMTSKTISYL